MSSRSLIATKRLSVIFKTSPPTTRHEEKLDEIQTTELEHSAEANSVTIPGISLGAGRGTSQQHFVGKKTYEKKVQRLV
jgi:hypothetical protein